MRSNRRKPIFDLKAKPDNGTITPLSQAASDKICDQMRPKFIEAVAASRITSTRVFRWGSDLRITE